MLFLLEVGLAESPSRNKSKMDLIFRFVGTTYKVLPKTKDAA
jgi:hypothetical protein